MSAVGTHARALFVPTFLAAVDTHWETETCLLWNQHEDANEEHELVDEISWIPELGAWKRFLKSQRKVKS